MTEYLIFQLIASIGAMGEFGGHVAVTRDVTQRLQHLGIEHVPCSDLLLHHLLSYRIGIHCAVACQLLIFHRFRTSG